jgi:hypothetical protein
MKLGPSAASSTSHLIFKKYGAGTPALCVTDAATGAAADYLNERFLHVQF